MAIPPSVLGQLAVLASSSTMLVVYAAILGTYFVGHPGILAPAVPTSTQGSAKSLGEWLRAGRGLSMETIRRHAGVDAELGVMRAQMLRRLFVGVLAPIAFGVGVAYAFGGPGATEAGAGRVSLANTLDRDFDGDRARMAYLTRRAWITVVGTWLVHVGALFVFDRFDTSVVALVNDRAGDAPAHHYAILVTDLGAGDDAAAVRAFFETCLGEGSVARVVDVDRLDDAVLPEEATGGDEPLRGRVARMMLGAKGPPTSLRGAVERWADRLAKLERLQALAVLRASDDAEEEGAVSGDVAEAEAAATEARRRAEAARDAETRRGPPAALVVVFSSLARATIALSAPLQSDESHAWTLRPMPEPRDVRWATLEGLPDRETRRAKRSTARTLKYGLFAFWTAILVALGVAIVAALEAAGGLIAPLRVLCALAAGVVPTSLAAFLLGAMAGILEGLDGALESHVARSDLQRAVAEDYAAFLVVAGFLCPVLGSTIFASALGARGSAFDVLLSGAQNVPLLAYTSSMLVINLAFEPLGAATRVADEVSRRVLRTLLRAPPPVTDRERRRAPKALDVAKTAGLDTFVTVVGVVYAPVAPVTTAFCACFFVVAVLPRMLACQVEKNAFDTRGAFAKVYASHALHGLLFCLLLQTALVALSGGFLLVAALLPLYGLWLRAKANFAARHATSVFGKSHARLALREAAALDAAREKAFPAFERDLDAARFFAAPEALPSGSLLSGLPVDAADSDATPRATALPAAWHADPLSPQRRLPAACQLDDLEAWLARNAANAAGAFPTK